MARSIPGATASTVAGDFVARLVRLHLHLAGVANDVEVRENAFPLDDHSAARHFAGRLFGPGPVIIRIAHGREDFHDGVLDGDGLRFVAAGAASVDFGFAEWFRLGSAAGERSGGDGSDPQKRDRTETSLHKSHEIAEARKGFPAWRWSVNSGTRRTMLYRPRVTRQKPVSRDIFGCKVAERRCDGTVLFKPCHYPHTFPAA
jgi:hypothetical protein